MFSSVLSIFLLLHVIKIKSETCVTPNNEQGNCVSLYTCPKLISVLRGEKNGDDYVRRSRCGWTPREPLVCCPTAKTCTTPKQKDGTCTLLGACSELLQLLETQKEDAIEYVRKSACEITDTEALVCCPSLHNNKSNQVSSQTKNDLLIPSRRYCGYQHSDDYGSEVQGADISEFPWLAGLYYKFKDGREKVNCQGAIINARYILTAAHCVERRPSATLETIRLGEYNIRNSTDCIETSGVTECSDPVQEYIAEEIVSHPQYKPNMAFTGYDIALIRLNKSIDTYSDYIRPICLPLPDTESPKPGSRIFTTGWGTSTMGSNAEVKKKVLNKLITNEECINKYNIVKSFSMYITDNQMCTQELSDNREFSCAGDSGGPVMFSHSSQWFIQGVNSFGSATCGDKYPVVHTKVAKFLDWIRDSMKPW